MINTGSDIASSTSKNSEPDDPLCFLRSSQLKNTDYISPPAPHIPIHRAFSAYFQRFLLLIPVDIKTI